MEHELYLVRILKDCQTHCHSSPAWRFQRTNQQCDFQHK